MPINQHTIKVRTNISDKELIIDIARDITTQTLKNQIKELYQRLPEENLLKNPDNRRFKLRVYAQRTATVGMQLPNNQNVKDALDYYKTNSLYFQVFLRH